MILCFVLLFFLTSRIVIFLWINAFLSNFLSVRAWSRTQLYQLITITDFNSKFNDDSLCTLYRRAIHTHMFCHVSKFLTKEREVRIAKKSNMNTNESITIYEVINRSGGFPVHSSHRGGGHEFFGPENTMVSFRKAVAECKTRLLEIDLRVTKDNHLVIMHGTFLSILRFISLTF